MHQFFISLLTMEHLSKSQIKFIRSLQQKKVRDLEHLFVAEGDKCIAELCPFFELVQLVTPDNAFAVEIRQMSSLRTPQGSLAVFRQKDNLTALPASADLCLFLDGVQDPGNVGTILRTADWFGIQDVYCSPTTADCWSPKVVQATMGALARVRVHYVNGVEWLKAWKQTFPSAPVYGTLLEGVNLYDSAAIPNRQQGVIVMGNEGNGISNDVRKCISHSLHIPSHKNNCIESLNVSIATAIVLAEFRRP